METIILQLSSIYIDELNKEIAVREREGYTVVNTIAVAGNSFGRFTCYPTIVVVMQKSK